MPKVNSLDPTIDRFDKMEFFVRKTMRQKKIKAKDVAKELGMSSSNFTRIFSERCIRVIDLMRILDYIGATPEETGEWLS